MLTGYLGVAVFVALLALAASAGVLPRFFVQGVGPTALRQAVLTVALILFAGAASYKMSRFVAGKREFFYWYSLALFLLAMTLIGALLEPAVGSLLGWMARCFQYLAGIYFFLSVRSASRDARARGVSVDEAVAELFRQSERKISAILSSIPDGHYELDRNWRFIRINDHALAYFGRSEREFIGQSFRDVFPATKGSVFEERCRKVVSEATSAHFEQQSAIVPDKWIEFHVYPTEEGGLSVFFRDITERKQAGEALRLSDAKFRSVLENSRDVIYRLNLQTGRYEYISPSAEKVMGFSSDELAAQSVETGQVMIHPDDLPVMKLALTRLEKTGRAEAKYRQRTKDGDYRWMSNHMSLTRDDAGRPLYRDGNIRDVTESTRAEQALEESERRFRALYENSLDGIMITCIDGSVLAANEKMCELVGMTEAEIIEAARGGIAVYDGDMEAALEERRRTGHFRGELRYRRKDGSHVPVEISSCLFEDSDGRILTGTVVRDITERKRAEEALRKSRDELELRVEERTAQLRKASAYNRNLIEASIDPLVTIDREGRISDVNLATEKSTGYSRDELIGTDFSDYFTDPRKARAGYRMVFNEGFVHDYPLEIRHRGGRITPVLYNASVYRDEAGQVIGVFAAARDITESRRLEAQLRQAQKMEALGTMSGGIAHDFNNILAAIIGFSELLVDHAPKGSRDARHLHRILEAGIRGRELVRQMLTFSRKAEQEKKPLPVGTIVKETVKLLRATTPSTINIRVNVSSESP